jgi:hypothetical protein
VPARVPKFRLTVTVPKRPLRAIADISLRSDRWMIAAGDVHKRSSASRIVMPVTSLTSCRPFPMDRIKDQTRKSGVAGSKDESYRVDHAKIG